MRTNGSGTGGHRRERRGAKREIAVLRVARLITARGEQLGRIRNLSPGGAMAEAEGHFVEGEPVTIELRSGRQTHGTIIWADDGRIGIAFELPIDPRLALAEDPDEPSRLPRVAVDVEASLCVGKIFSVVRVEDISLGGLSIAFDAPDRTGQPAVVTIEGLPPMRGVLRWQADGKAGISFNERLELETLSAWLALRLRA